MATLHFSGINVQIMHCIAQMHYYRILVNDLAQARATKCLELWINLHFLVAACPLERILNELLMGSILCGMILTLSSHRAGFT